MDRSRGPAAACMTESDESRINELVASNITYAIDVDTDPLQTLRVKPLVFAFFIVASDHGAERYLQSGIERSHDRSKN